MKQEGQTYCPSDRKCRFNGSLKLLGKVHWFLEATRGGSLDLEVTREGSLVPRSRKGGLTVSLDRKDRFTGSLKHEG